ncbi:SURF1 family protein [Tropicimonas sp. IMCC34043]|uniref:SURF1 family protein n=1 Tax=Tropicimonas sp. IMCC34043 TaxID=2248760 RepID=UPI000E23FB97|nr:SURF1 family protein [Tropicimonas sp. IMCC34043]
MRRYIFPLLVGLFGAAALIALGVWQLQRLDWKRGILAEIEGRIVADPVALPSHPDPAADRYLPVEVTGETGPRELDVLVSTHDVGAAFRIVTAFTLDDGRRILLDEGIVPAEAKDAPRPPAHLTVIGNLHWPDEHDSFTPDNDTAANYWYARDVDTMAAELGTEPVLVVARQIIGPDVGVTPLPVDTAGIPNNHLGYAIQWFGMAAVWLGMTALLLRRMARPNP